MERKQETQAGCVHIPAGAAPFRSAKAALDKDRSAWDGLLRGRGGADDGIQVGWGEAGIIERYPGGGDGHADRALIAGVAALAHACDLFRPSWLDLPGLLQFAAGDHALRQVVADARDLDW